MKDFFDILIIDDTVELTLSLKDILEENGFGTAIATDRKTAIEICRDRAFGLALIDIKLPDADGLELVEELSGMLPEMEFIIITGYGTIEIAAEAVRKKKIVSFEMKPLDLNRFLVLIHQIQERKHAAEALRLSEQRFQIFAESATDAIISIDEEGKIFYLNPEFEKIFGYRIQEIIGKSITFLIDTQEMQNPTDTISNILKAAAVSERKRLEVQGCHKSGKIVPLEISFGGFSTKEGKFYTAIVRDITERKVAEINLQRKLLIEKIVSTISARFVGVADFDQTIFDSLKEIRNYSKARTAFILIKDKTNRTNSQTYVWNDLGKSSVLFEQYDKFHVLSEWFFVELDGKRELLIPDTTKMPDHQKMHRSELQALGIRSLLLLPIMGKGEVVGCLGLDNIEHPGLWTIEEFNLLITLSNLFSSAFHRRSVEQDLIESEQIHHILLDATREGIIIFDLQGMITEVSNITLEIFKASKKEELIGKRFLEFIPAELRKEPEDYFSNKVLEGITQTFELTLLRNDTSRFVGEVNISLLREEFEKIKGYLVVIRDISERKKMDKQLIHTERMAGIGVMAAGMAHEINQPLNTISLAMDNLILSMNTGTPDKTYLKNKTTKIFDNITRIRNIIDHVRAFSKDHDDYIQSNFNINESIRNAKSMISEQFMHRGIRLALNLDGTLPHLVGNTYKFEQVIVNLIINAKDAIEEKENILNKDFAKVVEICSFREDKYVCVEVKDNGIGIELKDIDKIMLPFYSTKKEGVDIGLGLSISFGIIRDMNGTIEIQSERMKGTTVRIMIPLKKELTEQSEKKSKK
jgi:PAS domain S-box-containing protein